MKEKKEYEKCFVAFLDILGFKKLTNEYVCSKIYDIFEQIETQKLVQPFKPLDQSSNDNIPFEKIGHYIMSDSIVFYVNTSENNALDALVKQVSFTAYKLLELEKTVLIRGGIAKGDIFSDERIMYGKAINEAYILQEEVAVYPRIIFSESISINDELQSDTIMNWLYKDNDSYMCVNYLYVLQDKAKELHAKIENELKSDDINSPRVRAKYNYLLERITEVIDKV